MSNNDVLIRLVRRNDLRKIEFSTSLLSSLGASNVTRRGVDAGEFPAPGEISRARPTWT